MPPLVAVAAGVGAGVAVGAAGAAVGAAIVVGAGVAIAAYESGAAEWVYDEVITPVADAVGDVLRSDIGQFVLKAAATITPGMQWAVPLIDAAGTLARGGDIGDALKSAAISYVGSKVGNVVGETVGQSVASATGSATVGQIVGAGAGRASVALVMGQDPVKAFISGGINAGISAAAGWIEQQGVESGMGNTWTNLPDAAKNVISSSLSAALSGQNITEEVIWNAVLSSDAVTKTVNGFLEKNTGLNDGQISALTMGIQRTAAVAFSGGDVPQAVLNQLDNYAQDQFKDWFDDTKAGIAINNTMDKITGDYQRVAAQADKLDELGKEYNNTLAAYESTVNEINTGVDTTNSLETAYKRALQNFQANETQANADKLTAAVNAYNEHVTAFNKRYEEVLKPNLDYYEQRVPALENEFTIATESYDSLIGDLSVTAEQLNDELTPMYKELDKTFVRFMNPDFNEAEYRAIAGLDADEDAYLHWLSTGKEQGLPTNAADYDAAYNAKFNQILQTTLDRNGLTLGDVSKTQLDAFVAGIKAQYPDFRSLDMAPQYTIADEFAQDYNQFLREQAALENEAQDISDLVSGYNYAKENNIAGPVITNEVADMLRSVGINDFLVGEELAQADINALNNRATEITKAVTRADVTLNDISRVGVSDLSIGSGQARATYNPDTGLWDWNDVTDLANWSAAFYSPELGRMVRQYVTYKSEGGQRADFIQGEGLPPGVGINPGSTPTDEMIYYYQDAVTGNWIMNPDSGGISFGGDGYVFDTRLEGAFESSGLGQTLAELKDTAPVAFIEEAGRLTGEGAALLGDIVGDAVVEFSQNAVEYAQESDSNFIKDTAAVAIGGTGELAKTINDMLVLAKINPASSPLGRWARDTIALAGDTQSQAYTDALQRMSDRYNAAEGMGGSIEAIWENFKDAPGYFVAEYIAKEIVQEAPGALLAVATGGTSAVGMAAARRAGIEVSQEAGRYISQRLALSSVAALDFAETIGGAAGQGFDTAYQEAINSGMSEAEATDFAYKTAVDAALTGGIVNLITVGALDGGAVEKLIANRATGNAVSRAVTSLAQNIRDGATVMVKEGVQETLEEGAVAAIIANNVVQVNPDYDVAGEITLNAALGAISGAGTGGGVYTMDLVADTLSRVNPTVRNILSSGGSNPTAAKEALADLGLDEVVQNNLLSTVNDQYHSNADISRAFSAHPDFVVGNADILNGVLNSVGTDVTTYVNTYVDQRYVDIEEVKAAAAAEGVNLTDEQAQKYVTQTNDPDATTAALYSIQQEYDAQYTTQSEVLDMLRDLDFNTSPFGSGWLNRGKNINWQQETAQQFEGMTEAEARDAVVAYVDPRQVTEAEAKKFFEDMGYTPTQEEINAYVGQSHTDANFEAGAPDRIEAYVDPRQVTDAEARQFFSDLGYTPTDAEVADFVAQVAETEQKTAIDAYVDPRFVTYDEVQAIAESEGLTLTEALAETYLGQKDEAATLEAARGAFDPLATTYSEAKQFFADLGYTPSYDEIAQFVASATEEAQRGAVGEYVDPRQVTVEESRAFLEGLGYTPTDAEVERFVGQVNEAQQETAIGEYVDPRLVSEDEVVAAYAELGLSRPTEEDVQRLMGQYMETELAGRAEEYLPTARYNSIINILDNFTGEVGVSQEMQDALNVVKADMINALGDLGLEVAAIDQATQRLEDAVGTVASEGGDATGLYAYIDEAVDTLTNAGLTQEEVEATITGIVGTPAEGGAEATGLYAELESLGTDIDTVNNLLGTPATADADGTGLYGYIDTAVGAIGADLTSLIGTVGTPGYTDADGNEVAATGIFAQLDSLEAAGLSRDEAIAQLSADLGVAVTDLTNEITTVEENLAGDIAGVTEDVGELAGVLGTPEIFDDPNTAVDESRDPTGLFGVIKGYETAGMERDEAIQAALGELSTELGLTEKAILDELGLTEISLGEQIDASEAALTEQITGVEEQLGKQITGVEEQLGAFEAATDQDLDFISNLIGKPARDVTQTDVDFVADLVAQQQVLDELSLEYQQYDVNNDGLLDINDQTLLEQAMAGEEVQLAPESAFVTDPTGVYGALYNTQQDIQTQMDQNLQTQLDAITQMNTQINTQMQEDQRRRNVSDLRNMLMQQQDLYGQQVSVRTPDPMRINYFYDFSSIFANPQQASLFPSPYAKGGQVEDTTDKLLRIIGE